MPLTNTNLNDEQNRLVVWSLIILAAVALGEAVEQPAEVVALAAALAAIRRAVALDRQAAVSLRPTPSPRGRFRSPQDLLTYTIQDQHDGASSLTTHIKPDLSFGYNMTKQLSYPADLMT